MSDVLCDYCFKKTAIVSGKEIYPHRKDLYSLRFYKCSPCDAYVGIHKGTDKPFGRLANAELRKWKMKAHAAFDPIWRVPCPEKLMGRKKSYKWLSEVMDIPKSQCHIGMFDIETCKKVIEVSNNFVAESKMGLAFYDLVP
jgi:hypothetical protein